MDLFLNSGAAMLYTGTWDTPDLVDDEGNPKDDISMFKLPVDSRRNRYEEKMITMRIVESELPFSRGFHE